MYLVRLYKLNMCVILLNFTIRQKIALKVLKKGFFSGSFLYAAVKLNSFVLNYEKNP